VLSPALEGSALTSSTRLGDHDAPSTLLGVTMLGWPGQLVEIEAIAVATAVG
jgi:hypothetical protein